LEEAEAVLLVDIGFGGLVCWIKPKISEMTYSIYDMVSSSPGMMSTAARTLRDRVVSSK
jgi:hypothetical protein